LRGWVVWFLMGDSCIEEVKTQLLKNSQIQTNLIQTIS
jgi:hypothetical protein